EFLSLTLHNGLALTISSDKVRPNPKSKAKLILFLLPLCNLTAYIEDINNSNLSNNFSNTILDLLILAQLQLTNSTWHNS
ncbi:hypothetical protein QL093DRAFT_2016642, partial [Fusarium oxysporum]